MEEVGKNYHRNKVICCVFQLLQLRGSVRANGKISLDSDNLHEDDRQVWLSLRLQLFHVDLW